ncbi:MAG: hypothetical protein ACR2PQ_06935, partial [Myxococcota bacterium]
ARGRSLAGLAEGTGVAGTAGPRVLAQRVNRKKFSAPLARERGERNVTVVDGSWKAIWNQDRESVELYELSEDRLEQRDRSAEETERAAALEATAREWLAGCQLEEPRIGGNMDRATLERLRALGYVE